MNRARWLLAVSCGLLAIFINSCRDDTGSVGANILPASDLISAYEIDTTTVVTSMYLKDSVITSQVPSISALNNCLLGSYNDPIFGITKASIYAQVYNPPALTNNFLPWDSVGAGVDSAMLIVSLDAAYTGNLDPQTFEVDTVNAVMHATNSSGYYISYYSDTTLKLGSSIAIQQLTPNPLTDTFKIKLSRNWTDYIVSKMNSNTNYYTNFDSLVRGIYITVSNPLQLPGQGAILSVNLQPTTIGIFLYYHNPSTPKTKQWVLFPVGGGGGLYFSHFEHNYATSPFGAHGHGKHDSIDANNLIYMQSMGGALGRINFPNLAKNWAKMGPVIINKAEVDISVDLEDCPVSTLPESLFLYGTNFVGNPFSLPDELSSTNDYGGMLNYTGTTATYTFAITQYIQKVIDTYNKSTVDTDRGLFIYPYQYATTANRLVLYGAQHNIAAPSSQRLRMRIYYTPLNPGTVKKH